MRTRLSVTTPDLHGNKITDWRGADWAGLVPAPTSGAVTEAYTTDG
jgi:hypothetical protein